MCGASVAEWVRPPASAQVMISWLMSLSPVLGCVLTAWSLEPALDSVSPSLSVSPPLIFSLSLCLKKKRQGPWVSQSLECPTLAQVMISWFVGLSPLLGSVLTAQSLEPASDSVSPPLSAPPLLAHAFSLSLKNT